MKVSPLTSSLTGFALIVVCMIAHATSESVDELDSHNAEEGRLSLDLIDVVFNKSILENQSIDDAVSVLTDIAEDSTNDTWHRTKSYLSIAHLYWRYGQLPTATEVLTQLASNEELKGELGTDYYILAGRIADANGEERQALEHYDNAFSSTNNPEEREFIQIRLAMIDTDKSNVDALYTLALEREQAFKNRAAITLAVLGHTDKALELYKPDPEDEKYFRQLIRYAEWAIIAEDYETAQDFAWLAYDNTEIRFDGLYALTLVDEAYRHNNELDQLVTELSVRADKDEDLVDLHIDLLTDLERYDEAIALYRSMELDPTDLDARFRLLQIYDVSRRTDEMIAEYERLINVEPNTVLWYSGLASHYVAVAEPELAIEVWYQLEKNNSDNIDVLVHAARLMGQMGFEQESIAMVDRHRNAYGVTTTGQMFLFEVHLNKGRNNEALAALNKLVEYLPEDAGDLRTVADAYERLQKYENALQIFTKVEEHQGEALGYDDRMRLAWLQSVIGNREEALRLWQEIWIQEETPARRAFAESQFLLIAAELNKLARIAIDIENKLTEQTANKNEINLLVRIYTEVGDAFSAAEVVEQYARYSDLPEVEKLKQLGLVYLQLQEYDKYDKILRQLEEIDPENRIEHIQNIVLNMVAFTVQEESDEKLEDIQHWLEQLRLFDEESVTGEFEASVLSMSGFTEQAIESYRYALVKHPQHSDNLLLMGDLMKESGRIDEAVAVFQYVAEHSNDDNEFVVAIDGILNMIGQERFGQRLPPNDQATFRWAHRIILERITGRDDKFYLYTLLGEIAMETLDTEGEFVAVENSISQAGIRRLSVLRELVTMSTRDAGFFSLNQKAGDTERQLRYGRRLIGLRQQLPPDVYISIAKTLIEKGDTLGAEKSLNLVRDITGQIDINQTKADLFQEAGYVKKALTSYSIALALNQDDSTLLLKTAVLREANGQLDVANTLYMKGLLNILRTQPDRLHTESKAPSNVQSMFPVGMRMAGGSRNLSVNRDYQTFYEPFTQGVIATWPQNQDEIEANLAEIETMFQEELENVIEMRGEDEKAHLPRYSRLDHLAQFIRRLGASVGQENFVYARDLQLANVFMSVSTPEPSETNGRDESAPLGTSTSSFSSTMVILPGGNRLTQTVTSGDFYSIITTQYKLYGLKIPDEILAMVPDRVQEDDESIASTEATEQDLLTQDFRLAVERQNVDRIARLAAIMTLPDPIVEVFYQMVNNRNYQQALRYAKHLFDDVTVARLTSTIVTRLKDNPQELIQLLQGNTSLIQEIEKDYGSFFESIDELVDLLESPEAKQLGSRAYFMYSRVWSYLLTRENDEDLLQFFEYHVAQPSSNDPMMRSIIYDHINKYSHLINIEWSRPQRSRLKTAATDMMNQIDFQDEFVISYLLRLTLNFNIHETNRGLHLDVIDMVTQRVELGLDIEGILEDYFADERESAFLQLLNSNVDTRWAYTVQATIMQYFRDEASAMFEAMVEGECPKEEHIALLASRGSVPLSIVQSQYDQYELGTSLLECFPDNEEYRRSLIVSTIQDGIKSRVAEQLGNAYERDQTVEGIRTAYFLWSKQQEQYDTALAIANDGEPDLTKRDILDDILKRNDASRFAYGNHPDYILKLVRNQGNLLDSLSLSLRGLEDRIPKNIKAAAIAMAQLDETHSAQDAGDAIRLFWRNLNTQNLGGSRNVYLPGQPLSMFLSWPLDQSELGSTTFSSFSRVGYGGGSASTLAQYLQQQSIALPQSSEKLLEWLVQQFAVGRDLELHLIAQTPSQRRFAHQWYQLLVQAYALHPKSRDERLAELTDAVLEETADEHEFSLWLYLSNIAEQDLSDDLLRKSEKWVRELTSQTALQTLNIAQMFARAQEWDKALDYFTLYALNLSRSDPYFGQVRQFYGGDPNSPVDLFGLIDMVKDHTSVPMAQQFVERILPMVRPFGVEVSEHSLDTKAIELLSRVYPANEVLEMAMRVRPSITELLDNGTHDSAPLPDQISPLVEIIRVLISTGDLDEAIAYLKPIFIEAKIDDSEEQDGTSDGNDQIIIGGRVISVPAGATVSVSGMGGVTIAMGAAGGAVSLNAPQASGGVEDVPLISRNVMSLFRERDTIFDFENDEWMNLLVTSMTEWLDDEEMDERGLIEMLSVIAFEYNLREKPEKVAMSWSKISAWLTQYHRSLDRNSIRPFFQLAIDAEFALDPQVVSYALELELLGPTDIASLLKTLRETSDAEVAFATAQVISIETAGLSVLRELEEIGLQANDEVYTRDVTAKIQSLEAAYRELETSVL